MPARPTFWVHAGTHKTGTTALQALFHQQRDDLRRHGLCYPAAGLGRLPDGTPLPGHLNLVHELRENDRFDPGLGSLDDAIAEALASGCPQVLASAEDFQFLYAAPERLERLAARLRAAGFTPRALLYLRSQAEYVESLFAQMIRVGALPGPFEAAFEGVLRDGTLTRALRRGGIQTFPIDYGPLVAAFVRAFGREHVTLRAYRSNQPPGWLVADVLGALGARDVPRSVSAGGSIVNERLRLCDVAAGLRDNVARQAGPGAVDDVVLSWDRFGALPFEPLRTSDLLRLTYRLHRADARIRREWNVRVAPVTWPRLRSALASDLGLNRRARAARRAYARFERELFGAVDLSRG